jgi:hypothetical protein
VSPAETDFPAAPNESADLRDLAAVQSPSPEDGSDFRCRYCRTLTQERVADYLPAAIAEHFLQPGEERERYAQAVLPDLRSAFRSAD